VRAAWLRSHRRIAVVALAASRRRGRAPTGHTVVELVATLAFTS